MAVQQKYKINGMDCIDCARTITNGVSKFPGVSNVAVDHIGGTLVFDGAVPLDQLKQRIEALGYKMADESATPAPTAPTENGVIAFARFLLSEDETRLAVIGGVIILLGIVASFMNSTISTALYVVATLIALYPVARSGINNLRINHDFSINLLMTIAAVGALLIGETLEAATVVFLFAIGEALEGFSTERARESIRSLMTLIPDMAITLHDDHEHVVPVDELAIDDVILIKPGERLPADGLIVTGESGINQAPVTGESMPVNKRVGSEVFAGTINGSGALEVRVTRQTADNTINRIIRLVEEAQSVRAPSQRLVDQIARVYTPVVTVAALLIAIVPPLLFNAPFYDTAGEHGWLYRALSLLVIACPCALVISTPVTVISAIAAAARRGVLIKGGAHLEALATVRAFAFDKTGTLTTGKPVVKTARSADCETGEACSRCDDVLALAHAVERRSTHPLARAVTEAAQDRGLDKVYAPAEAVESLAGRGVQGNVRGKRVTVGSHALFDAEYPHSEALHNLVQQAEAQGETTMLVSVGENVRGYIGVADQIRGESAGVVRQLRDLGEKTVMLTGDNTTVAQTVAQTIGVDDVRANLLPEDKVTAVQALLREYGSVAMVGDGINDTPALATATVGIAMGGAGSAQALETADVALMGDDLNQLPFALKLARFARSLIRQNVGISFAIKALFLGLALFGATSLWLAILADVGTSLLVTLNGMRTLTSFRPAET
ncbi:MAG: heavy metal translocating P-type ATPase [Chloroflexi bacterium]|nr:heavy metal translocating P-type ATPase [Chloroflexota bacterium]